MSISLQGRVALVTGSSTGLGKAIAFGLAEAGARVAVNYARGEARAQSMFEEFQGAGHVGTLIRADVTDASDVDRMCHEAREKLGPIDIVVANATCEQPQRPIEEYDWAFYESMLAFFVKSPYLLTLATLEHMKRQRWGRFINITSEVFQLGVSPFTAYVAAKGGQVGFSRSLARELAPYGITVNMIAPGWIPVERHEGDPQAMKDAYLATVPAGRWGTPADVAAAVNYFASEGASFVTGQTLSVTGGHTVH